LKITQEINYILNYKPLLNFKKEINSINFVYCKNFFLFFLLFENLLKLNNKKLDIKNNTSLIIKKNKKFLNKSLLRAPNKYKKAQIKIELIRYSIIFRIKSFYNFSNINNIDIKMIIYFIIFFFFFFIFF